MALNADTLDLIDPQALRGAAAVLTAVDNILTARLDALDEKMEKIEFAHSHGATNDGSLLADALRTTIIRQEFAALRRDLRTAGENVRERASMKRIADGSLDPPSA